MMMEIKSTEADIKTGTTNFLSSRTLLARRICGGTSGQEMPSVMSNMVSKIGSMGFRVKYQEAGGVQMGKLFSTDLARDQPCGRDQCWSCLTKKEGESKKCRDRSVLYVTSCSLCNPVVDETKSSQVDHNKEVPRLVNMNVDDPSPSSMGR